MCAPRPAPHAHVKKVGLSGVVVEGEGDGQAARGGAVSKQHIGDGGRALRSRWLDAGVAAWLGSVYQHTNGMGGLMEHTATQPSGLQLTAAHGKLEWLHSPQLASTPTGWRPRGGCPAAKTHPAVRRAPAPQQSGWWCAWPQPAGRHEAMRWRRKMAAVPNRLTPTIPALQKRTARSRNATTRSAAPPLATNQLPLCAASAPLRSAPTWMRLSWRPGSSRSCRSMPSASTTGGKAA